MTVHPPEYWRKNKKWSKLLGQKGKVLLSTKIFVSPPELQKYTPYCFLLVKLKDKKIECMGESGVDFFKGDDIILSLRKLGVGSDSSIISYGIKAIKNLRKNNIKSYKITISA